jgi:hypothetical protein
MTRPLRSTPITGASPLLRAGPPARHGEPAARLPMFHAGAADQAHAASVPGTTWPVIGLPPGPAPAARSMATVSMPPCERHDTSTAVRVHSSSWSPPDTSPVPFPHRSPRRSSANAACGGLEPPPEGRLRRANRPSSLAQHRLPVVSLPAHQGLRSSFMAHAPAFSPDAHFIRGGQGELMVVAGGTPLSAASSDRRRQAARRGCRDRSLRRRALKAATILTPETAQALADAMPNARFEAMEGAAYETPPAEIAERVTRFLES